MRYLLDTNTIGYLIENRTSIIQHFQTAKQRRDDLILCEPVIYEIERGFRWRKAIRKRQIFVHDWLPLFSRAFVEDDDWLQAAQFWAEARQQGRQLSDMDLLVAAIAHRLEATLVTNDADFSILPIRRENWQP